MHHERTTRDHPGRAGTCAICAQRVSGALRAVDGVLEVQVQVREGRATVSHSGASTDALIHALERVGYTAAQAA